MCTVGRLNQFQMIRSQMHRKIRCEWERQEMRARRRVGQADSTANDGRKASKYASSGRQGFQASPGLVELSRPEGCRVSVVLTTYPVG
jgi:hypothetical protein